MPCQGPLLPSPSVDARPFNANGSIGALDRLPDEAASLAAQQGEHAIKACRN